MSEGERERKAAEERDRNTHTQTTRTWKAGGMMIGVGEPALILRIESCSIEFGLGEGDWPSTWKPYT